jgi:hypothetical protein
MSDQTNFKFTLEGHVCHVAAIGTERLTISIAAPGNAAINATNAGGSTDPHWNSDRANPAAAEIDQSRDSDDDRNIAGDFPVRNLKEQKT